MSSTLSDINSSVRTLLMIAVIAAGGYGWYALSFEPAQRLANAEEELATARKTADELQKQLEARSDEVEELTDEVARQRAAVERLETSLQLLKVDQRVAELRVIDQRTSGELTITEVEFVETTPDGQLIGEPRRFEVAGDQVYVDYLVVKFNDELVERADVERGTAIALFQRVFGNAQRADEGYQLDAPGTQPTAYSRGGVVSDFEQRFWTDFWGLAHDQDELERLGVRAMQGNATYYRVRPGERYRLELRTSGDFTMRPIEDQAKQAEEEPVEGGESSQ